MNTISQPLVLYTAELHYSFNIINNWSVVLDILCVITIAEAAEQFKWFH